ncbi:THC0290_0291 family protein [Flavobacterium crassostreae]|uniref:Glutamate dehydrogenase n=1 Tax=Flavobacterium crassostreae TaxID=1763534 RepID=A0A1B9E5Q6_9FLAO|nr:glutamate dehydrogenase [Flavobacterium crassostreae]
MLQKISFIFFILFGLSNNLAAQYNFAPEIGVIAGPVELRSDYGQRNNSGNNFKNSGFGIGFVHFLNFSYNQKLFSKDSYFKEHFKIRTELSYSKSNLKHHGKYVEANPNSLAVQQLKAMYGSTQLLNLGLQLEYHFKNIHDFEKVDNNLSPFMSLGMQLSHYNTKASSTLGMLGTTAVTYPKYLTPSKGHPYGFATEKGAVFSIVSSLGTRYKLSALEDLMVDLRFQYFTSDWVDGLNPNRKIYTENKTNDWLVWFNVGYIHYLRD